jgi:SAM-dependent methyltransferase
LEFLVRRFFAGTLEKRARAVTAIFAGWFSEKKGLWLDVGGSWGFCACEISRWGFSSFVLDVVRPAVQAAPVIVYPGDKVPFQSRSWDVVSMITMLHHVPDPAALVREAVRVSKRYVLLVEDLDAWGGRFWTVLRDQIFNLEFLGHPKQFRSQDEWTSFFESLGLKLVRFERVRTRLLGLPIDNGFYLFEKADS